MEYSEIFIARIRSLCDARGISINKEKMTDINAAIDASFIIEGRYILIQKGKKNYFLIKIV